VQAAVAMAMTAVVQGLAIVAYNLFKDRPVVAALTLPLVHGAASLGGLQVSSAALGNAMRSDQAGRRKLVGRGLHGACVRITVYDATVCYDTRRFDCWASGCWPRSQSAPSSLSWRR
jgi:hypothetical protein